MAPGAAPSLLATVLLAVLLAASHPAGAIEPGADESSERLGEVKRALDTERARQKQLRDQAETLAKEAEALQRQRVAAAAKVQDFEQELTRLEETLSLLAEEETDKAAALKRGRDRAIEVMMALERMARYPPEALMAQPGDPSDMVRSAILLRSAVPRLETQARDLRRDIEALAQTRRDMADRRKALAGAAAGLKDERLRLAGLIEHNREARSRTDSLSRVVDRQVEKLAREAKDLHALLEGIAAARRKREAAERAAIAKAAPPGRKPVPPVAPAAKVRSPRSFTAARGELTFPVVGPVISQYGDSMDTGLTRKGIEIETRDDAQVVAPFDGEIVFAGEFRGYGELLIIEHGEGYHTLLAGVARIDATLGQRVVAGEPVGIMTARKSGKPALYVELRRNGQPINPVPWLAARNSKVSG